MLKVGAWQPWGRERIRAAVVLNVPHAVGKSSEETPALTDWIVGWLQGKERYCINQNFDELGFGVSPMGEVKNGPIRASSSTEVYGWE